MLDLGTVVLGEWAGHALHECDASELTLDSDGSIALRLVEPRFVWPGYLADAPLDVPAEIRTSTGVLRARSGHLSESSFGPGETSATLHLDGWTWSTGRPATAWVGTLDSARLGRGNLGASDQRRANFGGVLLEGGGLRWYLWSRKKGSHIRRRPHSANAIVELQRGALDASRAGASLTIVEFVLGGSMHLQRLIGVDRDGVPVEAFGMETMGPRVDRHRPPLPECMRPSRWRGEMFRQIADGVEREGSRDLTFIATQAYLDSLGNHVDGAYLGAQVALEAFTARASPKETESRVRDKAAWKAWVNARQAEIAALAVDDAKAAVLLDVLRAAWRESTSRTVSRYFERRGVPLPREVLREVVLRNTVTHTMLMADIDERDVGRDLARLSVIQTVLVAALALYVGYAGPIGAGDNADQDPMWWPHRHDADAGERFLVELDAG